MNPGLKQRLVGAVVLIALAVIFLPMLLPGNNGSTMPLFGSNVPDTPGHRFEPIDIPLQLPSAAPQTDVSVVDQPQAGDVASKEKPQQTPPVDTVAQAPVPAPAATQPPPSQAAATPAISRPPAESWAVQLGSFSSSVNAIALQDKARKAGFHAYVEKVKGEQGSSYRVRIGPETSRERADALRDRVKSKLGMAGMVVPHKS